MRIERRVKRNWMAVIVVFVAVFLFSFLAHRFKADGNVDAASLAGFDPGYIISDWQMGNYTSMSEADIQNFLTTKNACRTTSYPGLSGAIWHYENGHFICLSEERFGDNDGEIGFQYGESAAHIIWQAAQDYRINPQVILVLLQKETGLITDPIPNNLDYRKATGFGCPDTAACSSKYYGFKNQIRNAVALFRTVLDGGWTNYPLGDNYIQYNPNAGCGGSVVNIRSLATSALYRYTPYQPNAGALAAGYGTAYCGAYGNRNFYLYFQDWFGGIAGGSTIDAYYNSIGGEDSLLGEPIENEKCGLLKGGCVRRFEVGDIYWSSNTGSWDVSGGILYVYNLRGAESGPLGYPIDREKLNSEGVAYQSFENGNIYWSKKTGAWDVSGGIYNAYFKQGTEWGPLGYPISSEKKEDGKVYQEFEHGKIYWTSMTGAWVIRDFVDTRWLEMGDFNSNLGVVRNGGVCGLVNEGCYQAFNNGNIYWSKKTGAWDVSGGIYNAYFKQGTEWGPLGYPISSEKKEDGKVYQEFEHGKIYWTSMTGAWVEVQKD